MANFKLAGNILDRLAPKVTKSIPEVLRGAPRRNPTGPLSKVVNLSRNSSPDDIISAYGKVHGGSVLPTRPPQASGPVSVRKAMSGSRTKNRNRGAEAKGKARMLSRTQREAGLRTTSASPESNRILKMQEAKRARGNRKAELQAKYGRTPSGERTTYSSSDRRNILAGRQANKVRGQERAVSERINWDSKVEGTAKARLKQAKNTEGGIPQMQDMQQRNVAQDSLDRIAGRRKKNAPKVSGQSGATASGHASTTAPISGKATKNADISGKVNLVPGAVQSENLLDQAVQSSKMIGKNISDHAGANGGYGTFLGGAAIRGAVGGAAIGGSLSAAQGGDFWEGAKEGAFKGAVGWGGYNALKAGVKAKGFGDISHNTQQIWNHHQRVSKPVKDLARLQQNVGNTLL